MTSLEGPVETWCLGIVFVVATRGREGVEREAGINPESFFYLASDGEIQINSCQSDGPQGKGLQQWGWLDGWGKDDRESGGLQGQGLTDELSVNPGFFHRFITSFPGLHTLV